MSKPAARSSDMHVCPLVDGTKPHVGGPITGPGVPTVLVGGMPAAVIGDMCTCAGPPDTIVMGSATVLIAGKPAARMGDSTAHGGTIVAGLPTVLIGDSASAGAATVVASGVESGVAAAAAGRNPQARTLAHAALTGAAFCESCES